MVQQVISVITGLFIYDGTLNLAHYIYVKRRDKRNSKNSQQKTARKRKR